VTDFTHPGQLAAQTAQHAQPQGIIAAYDVAASLGHGKAWTYKHRDLGFAGRPERTKRRRDPARLGLSGVPAKLAARAYRLRAPPCGRLRVLADWINTVISGRQIAERASRRAQRDDRGRGKRRRRNRDNAARGRKLRVSIKTDHGLSTGTSEVSTDGTPAGWPMVGTETVAARREPARRGVPTDQLP
jgi:hypothetical protein